MRASQQLRCRAVAPAAQAYKHTQTAPPSTRVLSTAERAADTRQQRQDRSGSVSVCSSVAHATQQLQQLSEASPDPSSRLSTAAGGGTAQPHSTASTDSSSSTSSSSSTDSTSAVRARANPQLGKLSYRMLVSYDGTAYSGWQLQLQSRARTIQAEIERALSTVLREDRATLGVCAAGRTDAGVHAVGQVRLAGGYNPRAPTRPPPPVWCLAGGRHVWVVSIMAPVPSVSCTAGRVCVLLRFADGLDAPQMLESAVLLLGWHRDSLTFSALAWCTRRWFSS